MPIFPMRLNAAEIPHLSRSLVTMHDRICVKSFLPIYLPQVTTFRQETVYLLGGLAGAGHGGRAPQDSQRFFIHVFAYLVHPLSESCLWLLRYHAPASTIPFLSSLGRLVVLSLSSAHWIATDAQRVTKNLFAKNGSFLTEEGSA